MNIKKFVALEYISPSFFSFSILSLGYINRYPLRIQPSHHPLRPYHRRRRRMSPDFQLPMALSNVPDADAALGGPHRWHFLRQTVDPIVFPSDGF